VLNTFGFKSIATAMEERGELFQAKLRRKIEKIKVELLYNGF